MAHKEIYRKYSKTADFYMDAKHDFFTKNSILRSEALRVNGFYQNQPVRLLCKLCFKPLISSDDFTSHGIPYTFCLECNHLNGRFQDSEEFFEKIYLQENSIEYNSSAYMLDDYLERVKNIYTPKVEFLKEALGDFGISILDVGCGAGHFVAASLLAGLKAQGIDASKSSVDFGNKQLKKKFEKEPLNLVDNDSYLSEIENSKSDLISFIGVIEHIQDLESLFSAIRNSKADYIYYSVPMVSLTVLLETQFPNVFPRHLSADHTHLFTEASLNVLNNLLNIDVIAEWRFGTDVLDFIRSLAQGANDLGFTSKAVDYFFDPLYLCSDSLQAVLDKRHFCSEIHVVGRKK